MRESPLEIYCSNEIQSQIRGQRSGCFKSPFVVPAANMGKITKLRAVSIDFGIWCVCPSQLMPSTACVVVSYAECIKPHHEVDCFLLPLALLSV